MGDSYHELGPPPPGQWRRGGEGTGYLPTPTPDPYRPPVYRGWMEPILRELDVVAAKSVPIFAKASPEVQEDLTTVIFTSLVPSHPGTYLLEKVYNSIRYHLPRARILILADGLPGEEPWEYTKFKESGRKLGWEIMEFTGRRHQTLMLRAALDAIDTPLVMVGEHDWGINPYYMDWSGISDALFDPMCRFNLIQIRQTEPANWEFEFFSSVEEYHGINLLPTTCFQGPMHIANCEWYRKVLEPISAPNFLERDELRFSMATVGTNREMACYIPPGRPVGRLFHLNGRGVNNLSQIEGIGVLGE